MRWLSNIFPAKKIKFTTLELNSLRDQIRVFEMESGGIAVCKTIGVDFSKSSPDCGMYTFMWEVEEYLHVEQNIKNLDIEVTGKRGQMFIPQHELMTRHKPISGRPHSLIELIQRIYLNEPTNV